MSTIRVGQPVRLRFSQTANEYYVSRLVETTAQDYLIEVPLHQTKKTMPEVTDNDRFWIEYHSQDGALCRFEASLLEAIRIPVLVWRIRIPQPHEIQREQRREFVRVPADIQVRLEYATEGGSKKADVYSRDISGGGLGILLPRGMSLRPGITVHAKFTLPNGNFPVDVQCVVVRVSEPNEKGLSVGSLQFLNIKESVRQRVIQYTFWRQRLLK